MVWRSSARRLGLALALSTLPASLAVLLPTVSAATASGPSIEVSFPRSLDAGALDGRLLVVISRTDNPEPRFQVGPGLTSRPLFGIDVDGLQPEQPAIIDATARGYPIERLDSIPAGDYYVQAVLNVYTTFRRADGHTIKAHMDQWEGQHWNRSPGNLMSDIQRVHIDPEVPTRITVRLTKRIPPVDVPADTTYIKRVKFKSEILSKWWGHDMYLGALVVLPEGFESHPDARYPVAYNHGHFQLTFNNWSETPPAADLTGAARAQAEAGYQFFQDWKSGRLGRWLIVLMQHPTPFYDDSYAVNSANNGPYGDALTQELIPLVEQRFRAMAQPWARIVYGGSTGGWESLAWQAFYPDMFNGAWAFCPDPVDFRYFQLVNIYEDRNAFYPNNEWKQEPIRPWQRSLDNQVAMTQRDASHFEEVLGTRGRSGQQMDIFMSVFGPAGSDGYPRLLYDKWTGEIDRGVTDYWRDHYDLRDILQRGWLTLGPKLAGKLHVYMGDTDTYYLEEAAYQLKAFLEGTTDPPYGGSFEIGQHRPHCYSGEPAFPGQWAEQHVFPEMLERILNTAPPAADVTSWRY
jgi:hypothetical protein